MSIYCKRCSYQNTDTAKFCKGCGTEIDNIEQSQPVTSLNTGMVLENRYEIKRLIKTGGMGSVYECYDNKFKVTCAVKEMLLQSDERKKQYFIDRFTEEARILHSLRHQNLPVVTNYFVIQERYYLVMDYIKGKDLETILNNYNKGIPEHLVIEWAKEILEALEYLHNQKPPIIYRDLKPANVMLREEDNRILLIDFGIARVVNPESDTIKTGIGTPAFSAMEVFQGKPELRSDIYSLGATLHCLLTGITPKPFTPLNSVRSYNPIVSIEMDNIVMKASHMKASDRYVNAGEMRKALENIRKKPVSSEEPLWEPEKDNSSSPEILTPSMDIIPSDIPSEFSTDNAVIRELPVKKIKGKKLISTSFIFIIILILLILGISVISLPDNFYKEDFSLKTDLTPKKTALSPAPVMIDIKGGIFYMGNNNGKPDEKPVRSVTLSGYSISRYVVTNEEFANFLNDMGNKDEEGRKWIAFSKEESRTYKEDCSGIRENGSKYNVKSGYERYPVVYVTWYGAVAYCNWLSDKEHLEKCYGEKDNRGNGDIKKKGYRLPTEAEWEYACRAGTITQYYWGDNMDDDYCWDANNSGHKIQPVGIKRPNSWGLYDMSGNVWEWCLDYYEYYPSYEQIDPVGLPSGDFRVIRGGCYAVFPEDCRSSSRFKFRPNDSYCYLGFRIARTN